MLLHVPIFFAEADFNPLHIEIFVHIVIGMSAKTFTHLFAALSKYDLRSVCSTFLELFEDDSSRFAPLLRDLLGSEQEQIHFLQSVFDLFRNREYTMIVLVDRLIRMQLIDPASVVNWIFSPQMKAQFNRLVSLKPATVATSAFAL